MKHFPFVSLVIVLVVLTAQNDIKAMPSKKAIQSEVGKRKKTPASFKGNLKVFLKHNLYYPEEALIGGLEDTVWVIFDIDIYGTVKDPRIEKPGYRFFDEEALRVIKLMPAWKPETINGEAVSSCQALAIVFRHPDKK